MLTATANPIRTARSILPAQVFRRHKSANLFTVLGWFPGYAINVETGRRLNIFFGENSMYDNAKNPAFTGRDMLWNPTDQVTRGIPPNIPPQVYYQYALGGQHWVYVMYTDYDGCEALRRKLTREFFTNDITSAIGKVGSEKILPGQVCCTWLRKPGCCR